MLFSCVLVLTPPTNRMPSQPVQPLEPITERTAAQILFRYLTQVGIAPLTGTRSEAHMREDLAIFEFELTESERVQVESLLH